MYLRNTFYAAAQHSDIKLSDSNLPRLVEHSYHPDEAHERAFAAAA